MASLAVDSSTMVSDQLLDEIWLMMHMAVEIGRHHENHSPYEAEAECEVDDIAEVLSHDQPADPFEKEKAFAMVAESLIELGDDVNREMKKEEDVRKLSQEISEYIREVLGPKIENKVSGAELTRQAAVSVFSQSGILGKVYSVFKQKVDAFVGPSQDLEHIALVTNITRGVAQGLQNSTSGAAGLLATVSTNFVKEKYSGLLQGQKELFGFLKASK